MKKEIDHWEKARFHRSKVNKKPLSKQTKTLS